MSRKLNFMMAIAIESKKMRPKMLCRRSETYSISPNYLAKQGLICSQIIAAISIIGGGLFGFDISSMSAM
jgi:hypothetical protein